VSTAGKPALTDSDDVVCVAQITAFAAVFTSADGKNFPVGLSFRGFFTAFCFAPSSPSVILQFTSAEHDYCALQRNQLWQ